MKCKLEWGPQHSFANKGGQYFGQAFWFCRPEHSFGLRFPNVNRQISEKFCFERFRNIFPPDGLLFCTGTGKVPPLNPPRWPHRPCGHVGGGVRGIAHAFEMFFVVESFHALYAPPRVQPRPPRGPGTQGGEGACERSLFCIVFHQFKSILLFTPSWNGATNHTALAPGEGCKIVKRKGEQERTLMIWKKKTMQEKDVWHILKKEF